MSSEVIDSKQSLFHVGMRYAALASRPALIWLLVVSGRPAEAAALGSLLLVASVISMVMSNEAHLQLYATIFAPLASANKKRHRLLSQYLHSIVMHIVLLLVPAYGLCLLFFPTVNPLLAIGLALADRIADELLRIRLYRKHWTPWTFLLLGKHVAAALPALVALLWFKASVEAWYVAGALLYSIWLLSLAETAVLRALPSALSKLADLRAIISYISLYARVLFPRQVAAILCLNVVVLDRYVGMNIWSHQDVAYIVMAGQIINGLFFLLEAKQLSEHRANFIDPTKSLEKFWIWRPYIQLMLACAVGATLIFAAGTSLGFLPAMSTHMYGAVGVMICSYAVFYISLPFNDYLYYRGKAKSLAIAHALVYAIYAFLIFKIPVLQLPLAGLSLLLFVLMLRVIALWIARRQFDAPSSSTTLPVFSQETVK